MGIGLDNLVCFLIAMLATNKNGKRIHSDSKKRRSFLTLLFTAGDPKLLKVNAAPSATIVNRR